jgi:hypothetical protein
MAIGMIIGSIAAQGATLWVAGSPTNDTGLQGGSVPSWCGQCVNDAGMAVGYAYKFVVGEEARAVRWDASGTAATELGIFGTDANGSSESYSYAVNSSGMTVGRVRKYIGGNSVGTRAVRWNASGTTATELGNLGTDTDGSTEACAYAVNSAGTAVGYAYKIVGGINKGIRPVRWNYAGTAATELGNLGTDEYGNANAEANAINDAGTAVGWAVKFIGYSAAGSRAVRWNSSGTVATELGDLGTNANGSTFASALAVNSAGTATGWAYKYDGVIFKGTRAVRWNASGTAATELGNLGTNTLGETDARAYAVNSAGTVVGWVEKYVGDNSMGNRAVRWDASGTTAIELGNLGTDPNGYTDSFAWAVNDAGTAVGYAYKYNDGIFQNRAVIWLPDATVIDLNDLGMTSLPAGGTWKLNTARDLSADGFVAGEGWFDPDGDGPMYGYDRLWVAQVGLGGKWTKATGGTWGRGPNWSTGTPAMQVGDAEFNLNTAYTVTLDRDERTRTMTVSAGSVTLSFAGHTLATDNGLSILSGATLKGAGTIEGDITNAGTLSPGNGLGTLTISGNLTSTNSLYFEIASLASYDEIDVSQTFTAGGSIVVSALNGYTPSYGDSFHLMSFGSLTDNGYAFDFSQATLPEGLQWNTTSFSTTGTISVVPEPSVLALLLTFAVGCLRWWRRWA